jgi:tetrahydromethanopterin S-methyltransferase subunit G
MRMRVPCFVLTSASWEAVGIVLETIQLQIPVFAAEVPQGRKQLVLRDIAQLYPVGNYYDDQETEVPDNWRFIKCVASC